MGLRGPKGRGQEAWMIPVADLMIQEGMSFSAAAQALGVKWENSAAERAARYCEQFRNILDSLSYRYYASTGDNPLLTKGFMAGVLVWSIRRLQEQDRPDAIATPGKLLADMMGWLEEKPEAAVVGNLNQADIDRIKAELKAKQEEEAKGIPVQIIVVGEKGEKPN